MGTQQIKRQFRAPVGMALLLGAALAWPGCVNYDAPIPCESDTACGVEQACDLARGFCRPLSCVRACEVRECGDDGCGLSCGTCPAGESCSAEGQCIGTCSPDCSGRECGDDGCGGSCGTCGAGEVCTPGGMCHGDYPCCGTRECGPDPCLGTSCGTCSEGELCDVNGRCQPCTPDCGGRECGPDPVCGLLCGECPPGLACSSDGMCEGETPCCGNRECGPDPCAGTSCGTCGMDEWCDADGRCQGTCTPDCTGRECGDDGCGGSCGTCAWNEQCHPDGLCSDECWPDCTGRECGDDGCGGTCGTCAPGEVCDATASCLPQGTQQAGEPCDFDTVNVGTGACVSGLYCLGVLADPSGEACTTASDCIGYLDPLWNADCVGGFCGASFCSPACENGACDAGFLPQDVSGLCLCIPVWQDPDPGLPGSPCAWDQVNPEAGSCMASLTCLGMAPDPINAPCAVDADCAEFVPANHNADCVGGGCGASFCSGRCDVDGSCATGFIPMDVSGTCYCIPGEQTGTGQPGDPCPFDQVHPDAAACAADLVCLSSGAPMDACANVSDCVSLGYPEQYNPECTGGFCGFSFCAGECSGGLCDAGFVPIEADGTCYCIPDTSGATGQAGEPCPFDQVNADASACAVGLSCLGIMPEAATNPCPAGVADCLAYFAAYWNLDCVNGGCGASFCSPECNAGACDVGFDPYDIEGACYCVPNQ